MKLMFDVCQRGDEFYVLREDKVRLGLDESVRHCDTCRDAMLVADLYQASTSQHRIAVDAIKEELDYLRGIGETYHRLLVRGLIEMAWKLKVISDEEYKDFSASIGR